MIKDQRKFRIKGSVRHESFGLLSDQEMDYLKHLSGYELIHETRRLLRNAKARQRATEKKEGKRQAAYPEGEQLYLFEVEDE